MLRRSQLHPYQRRIARTIIHTPQVGVFAEMGLGKTVSTLTAVSDLYESFAINNVLIVSTLRAAEHVWPQEIEEWDHTAWMAPMVRMLLGSARYRVNMVQRCVLEGDQHVAIINRENIPWLVDYLDMQGWKWPWDMIVLDESTSFASHASKRWKAMVRASQHYERCVLLTGTPASNGLMSLWGQMYLLDHGERLGRNITAFRSRYFTKADPMGWRYNLDAGSSERIHDAIGDVTLSLKTLDYLKMPPLTHNRVAVGLTDKQRKQYNKLEKDFFLELDKAGDQITATSVAALSMKLRQYCQGAVWLTDEGRWSEVHSAKLDALAEILDGADGPVLVAYAFKHDWERIKTRFKHAVEVREKGAIDRWNQGKVNLLCCHPASAGHGLNLQKGPGHTIVWFGPTWSYEQYEQTNARLWRQGQTRPVIVHQLSVRDTIEDAMRTAISGKRRANNGLMDAIKRYRDSR